MRVQAPPDVVRDRLWTDQARVDDLEDGTSRLHLSADHAEGAVLMLVGMGLEVDVESPDELAAALRALAHRCLRAVDGTSGTRVGAPVELG